MSKADKAGKVVFIYWMFILVTALVMLLIFRSENLTTIADLKIEVEELDLQIENLLKQKQLYEEILSLYEDLSKNLNQQIRLLEIETSSLNDENEQLRIIRTRLTAYSPLDNVDGQQAEGNPNRTSIGKQVSRGIVAADPRKLPYGTILEIPDWGIVEVGDTGGALRKDSKNIRIDLFHETYAEAMKFGVKDMDVKILEWGN